MKKTIPVILFIFIFLAGPVLFAQKPYKLPPKEVVDIVTAPPTPRVSMSPEGDMMLLITSESMPSISYMAQPLLRIAGMRITPKYNSRQTTSFSTGITIMRIKDRTTKRITRSE